MATIREVSKEAGVSRATVTRVLQTPEKVASKTRERVQAAIKKLDYRPNMLSQTFRNKRSNTIVVMVPNIANPLFAKIISGIETVTQKHGYNLLLGDTHNSSELEAHYINLVETQLAAGVLQLSSYSMRNSPLPNPNIKAVGIAGTDNTCGAEFPTVRIDSVEAAKTAVNYLINQGHKRIAVITGPKDNSNTEQRLEGYRTSLGSAGIAIDTDIIFEGDFRLASGQSAVTRMLKQTSELPTAIFCMNDEMAIGAINGLSSAGLTVPEDMSVIGFDDIDFAAFVTPQLTTIAQPANEMGQRGATLLIQMIEEQSPSDQDIVLPFEFVVRNSVSKIEP
ncbi:MAG: LacI family DNA-binding transcriptional regulator [Kordiimonas sp.]